MTKKELELERKVADLRNKLEQQQILNEVLAEKSNEDDNTIAKLNTIISCLVGTIEQLDNRLKGKKKNGI